VPVLYHLGIGIHSNTKSDLIMNISTRILEEIGVSILLSNESALSCQNVVMVEPSTDGRHNTTKNSSKDQLISRNTQGVSYIKTTIEEKKS
jgi:hypothetical protein